MRSRPAPGGTRRSGGLGLQTPTVPLTLRGMHRPRHRLRSSALLSFSVLSVLALLAGAILPALAQAEDSSGIQYEVEHYESGAKPKKHPGAEEQASASHKAHPKTGPSESTHESEESEGSRHGAATGNGGEGGGGNGGHASKANSPGGGNQASEGLGGEKEVGGTAQGQNASHSSGGSSPLVPILIAIALLAAISIGAVIYRQRRQGGGGSGSPVSPKAG